jgi:hypothetical protein
MIAEATTGRKGWEQQDWGELAFDHNGSKVVNSEASHRRGLRRGRASDMVMVDLNFVKQETQKWLC